MNGHIVNGIFLHQEAALDCPSGPQTQDLGLWGNGGLPCSNGMVSHDRVHPQDSCFGSGLNLHPIPNVGLLISTKAPTVSHLLQKVQSYPPLQKDNSHSLAGICTSVSGPKSPIFQEPSLVTILIATPYALVVSPKGRYSNAVCGNETRQTGLSTSIIVNQKLWAIGKWSALPSLLRLKRRKNGVIVLLGILLIRNSYSLLFAFWLKSYGQTRV